MPVSRRAASRIENLKDLTRLVQATEGFYALVAALKNGHGGSIDGAWGSAAALAASAVGLHAPATLLVVLAHPREVDGWADDIESFAGVRPFSFRARDALPSDSSVADDVGGQRLKVLKQLQGQNSPRYLLTTIQALIQPVPAPAQIAERRRRVRVGEPVGPEELSRWLVDHGFHRNESVELPGDFSRRGGIVDVFSPDADAPVRFEFFGDEIESIRHFSLQTQRSTADLPDVELMAADLDRPSEEHLRPGERANRVTGRQTIPGSAESRNGEPRGHLADFLPVGSWTVLVEPDDLLEQGKHYLERVADSRGLFSTSGVFQQLVRFPNVKIAALPGSSVEATCHLRVESVERFTGALTKLREELDGIAAGDQVMIACHNEAERKRLDEVLKSGQVAQADRLRLVVGHVRAGFRMLLGSTLVPPYQGPSLGRFAPHPDLPPQRGRERDQSPASPSGRGDGGEGSSAARFAPHPGPLPGGERGTEPIGVVVLSDHELFHREDARPILARRRVESRALDSFLELVEGDLVVHVSHGIARYRGMQVLDKKGNAEEHLILEFREGVRVYVPASKIDLVQKYVGGAKTDPELSKLGGLGWQRKKEKVEAAVLDLAAEMVDLQALREAQPGTAFPLDSEWQAEFEAAFPYQETPDQLTTLAEIRRDLERPRPMDRLICGDVGYGKTELAIRAAFKVIDSGKQVAVLVPTTVLAEQHYRTFSQRLAEYPFVVESLSRFRTHGEQRRIVERLAEGGVDVVVGTHRLVSADVRFKDLGLVIIDEEQRFGVEHKERLKRLRQMVDVLTMTATPIPRTLHLALLGIRDISNLETPPPDRLAIETRIARFDPDLIRHAILRELNREGQVYFVHNRVYNIREIASRLQSMVPEARIAIAHGQMAEHELEAAMIGFVRRESDILVATTIIESGLDIPNVNTIFINQADNYGLADLHQLRGRVGRYKHRAYAYLLLDSDRTITPTATRRLKAIEEFTELGAGFKIALRDLEIRGAGNILGTQQSGHIAAVGYEMYCQLLGNAVRRIKQQPVRVPLEITVDLPWRAYLPRDYVLGQRLRIEVYRRLARIRRLERLEDFRQELRDRFGPIPEAAEWLLRLTELRVLAARWQLATVHLEKPAENAVGPTDVVLGYRSERKINRLAALSGTRLRVVDGASAYFRLSPEETSPEALYHVLKDLLLPAKQPV
jgi:transcription-repair coupling factor (superfamily II helicase)